MRRSSLPVIPSSAPPVGFSAPALSDEKLHAQAIDKPTNAQNAAGVGNLGVLSLHLSGGRCHVRCPYCYLGARAGTAQNGLPLGLVTASLARLAYHELAVAASHTTAAELAILSQLADFSAAQGRKMTVTTTIACALELPVELLAKLGRLNLSVDPQKAPGNRPDQGSAQNTVAPVRAQDIAEALVHLSLKCAGRADTLARPMPQKDPRENVPSGIVSRQNVLPEIVLLVTLTTPEFAETVLSGLLAELLQLPQVSRVALSGLKPPPLFCDRSFWLRAFGRIGSLLRAHLHTRLFLDCYVAARILGLSDCPARPDLSPVSKEDAARGQLAFRSCVYQTEPDFVTDSAQGLAEELVGFTAPKQCPFVIR